MNIYIYINIYVHVCIQNPPPLAHFTVPTIYTIQSDDSTTVTQTEFTFTEVHGENKNVTNHD